MTRRLPIVLWVVAVGLHRARGGHQRGARLARARSTSSPTLGFTLLVVGSATTGAIVAARVPGNAVGWILLALGAGLGFALACGALRRGERDGRRPGRFPGDEWLAWLGYWLAFRPSSARRRPCSCCSRTGASSRRAGGRSRWFIAAGVALAAAGSALQPGPVGESELRQPGGAARARRPTSCSSSRASPTCSPCPRCSLAAARADRSLPPLARRRAPAAEVVHLSLGGRRRRARALRAPRAASSPTSASSSACSPSPRCRWRPASRCCATGSTTSTS